MKKIQKFIFDAEKYATLEQAKKLNNSIPSDVAWVYDRFVGGNVLLSESIDIESISEKMEQWIKSLPSTKAPFDDSLFRLARLETFDNQEQIDFLIKEGKFFYAPVVTTDHLKSPD